VPRSARPLAILAVLAACVSVDYAPPEPVRVASPYAEPVDRPYDEVWASLAAHAEREGWLVEISEHAIGLLEVSFLAPDPVAYADCGHAKLDAPGRAFEGPLAVYLRDHAEGGLRVAAEIRVAAVDSGSARVQVRARYSLGAVVAGGRSEGRRVPAGSYSWSFSTGGDHALSVPDAVTGRTYTYTCQPSYAFERQVFEAARGEG
jgi:hypothetical protein